MTTLSNITINRLHNDSHLHARSYPYCKGFVDAFKDGIRKNDFEIDMQRFLYNLGYDAGITEYCNATHPEE